MLDVKAILSKGYGKSRSKQGLGGGVSGVDTVRRRERGGGSAAGHSKEERWGGGGSAAWTQ